MTDWYARCAYDPLAKRRFHAAARARLRQLAAALGFAPASFDLYPDSAEIRKIPLPTGGGSILRSP